MSEAILHQQIADYLHLQYPKILFRTDFAAGIKMTMGQAAKHKRLQAGRAWPDIFIAEPRYYDSTHTAGELYCGLFIEIKKEGTKLYRQDGMMVANPHFQEQAATLKQLHLLGYKAVFAVGFDEAKEIIDNYLAVD
jgi:hypothetical protein